MNLLQQNASLFIAPLEMLMVNYIYIKTTKKKQPKDSKMARW